ncbi:transcriptional coactivator/pterin dehydratase [Heliocybe sulcata]|uniref:4a-hydroxytetrahydrobiopterin dehydratase n=1 Tax=Heliocybe sulcata TaxID=5364 RepID=A0A5C3NAU4_9AGAM|nr:transcriptional coactivator/pterin dehydratase [Heliocybe sulcata]
MTAEVPDAPQEPRLLSNSEMKEKVDQFLSGRRWNIERRNKPVKIAKRFHFPTYDDAIDFTNVVAEIAKKENHHPAILTEAQLVTVQTWTDHGISVSQEGGRKRANGITLRDVRLASLVENAFVEQFVANGRYSEPRMRPPYEQPFEEME